MIGEKGESLLSGATASRYEIPTPSIQSALANLSGRGITWQQHTEAGTRVRLEDPFLAAWLREVRR